MSSPDLAPGTIEQVIYTWSEINRGGGKGLGFGAVSPGLASHVGWLNSWPKRNFDLLVEGTSRSDTFEGWHDVVTEGAFGIDDYNIVYRKMSDGGVDSVGRDRFVVHALVGRRDDIDLARVSADCDVWLSAQDCPLNDLPALDSLSTGDLQPRVLVSGEEDEEEDDHALRLIEKFSANAGDLVLGQERPETLDRLVSVLHIAVPTALWPDLEMTTLLARRGLEVTATVRQRPETRAQSTSARRESSGMGTSNLHRIVDQQWTLAAGTTWEGFVADLPKRLKTRSLASPAGTGSARPSGSADPRESFRLSVAAALGSPTWDFDADLGDEQLGAVLYHHEDAHILGAWMAAATGDELRAVFAASEQRQTFARVNDLVSAAVLDTPSLADAWRRSVAAPLGFALLSRDVSALDPNWAVPPGHASQHHEDVRRLVEQLVTSEAGKAGCYSLFTGGIATNNDWRPVAISALLKAGDDPGTRDFVFGKLLVGTNVDPRALCEAVADHLDEFGQWLELPEPYRQALEHGLNRPSWIWRLLKNSTRHR